MRAIINAVRPRGKSNPTLFGRGREGPNWSDPTHKGDETPIAVVVHPTGGV